MREVRRFGLAGLLGVSPVECGSPDEEAELLGDSGGGVGFKGNGQEVM